MSIFHILTFTNMRPLPWSNNWYKVRRQVFLAVNNSCILTNAFQLPNTQGVEVRPVWGINHITKQKKWKSENQSIINLLMVYQTTTTTTTMMMMMMEHLNLKKIKKIQWLKQIWSLKVALNYDIQFQVKQVIWVKLLWKTTNKFLVFYCTTQAKLSPWIDLCRNRRLQRSFH